MHSLPEFSKSPAAAAAASGTGTGCDCQGEQTRKSPIPVHPIPDLAGNRGGNFRFPIGRESGIRRESGRFPIRPGTGNRGPDSASRGFPGLRGSVRGVPDSGRLGSNVLRLS